MMLLYQLLHVLFTLHSIFMHFLGLTYQQDAEVSVPVFCCFSLSEKLVAKYSRNWTKQKGTLIFSPTRSEGRRGDGDEPRGRLATLGRGQGWARAGPWRGRLANLPTPPFRLSIPDVPRTLKQIGRAHV